jgi:hypothetical protein
VIVIARPVGQLANRLFQYAHFVALAADTGTAVANPGLGAHADHFPAFAGDALCRYPPPRRNVPAALRPTAAAATAAALRGARALPRVHAIDVPDSEERDLESPQFAGHLHRGRLVLVAGWQLRAYGAFARQREELRRVFTPAPAHVAAAEAAVERARAAAALVVGVHRRRGDYAAWNGGRYLFDDEQYAAVMRRARDLLGRDVAFVVCSDEPVPAQAFAGLSVHPGPGLPVEDLHALSLCDRLIGPPSTFGSWASFMGEVPRYEMETAGERFGLDAFRISEGG